jgi:hypothetical protein
VAFRRQVSLNPAMIAVESLSFPDRDDQDRTAAAFGSEACERLVDCNATR